MKSLPAVLSLLTLSATLVVLAAVPAPPPAVPSLDLSRYAGLWYELARLPNRFQKGCVGDVTADYTPKSDGLAVDNRCRRGDGTLDEVKGRARRPDTGQPAALQVRFAPAWLGWLPFVWADYRVIELADDYHYAVVSGGDSRDYLWILSRTPTLPEAEYTALLQRIAAQGYDVRQLVRTPQSAR